jgi:branched-chain amino acid transport system substrate-binding protein
MVDGVEAAEQQINDNGGINGGPLDVIVCDTENDPAVTTDCANSAIDDGAVAVAGSLSVQQTAYYPILEEDGIPNIGNNPAGLDDYTSPNSFPIIGGAIVSPAGLASALAEEGYENISVARIGIAEGAVIGTFANQALQQYGLSVVNDIPVDPGTADMAPSVTAALEGGTDAVIVAMAADDALNFVVTLKQTDPDIGIALVATETDRLVEALGDESNGILESTQLYPLEFDTQANTDYVDALAAIGVEDTGGQRRNAYEGIVLAAQIASGIKGKITAAKMFTAMEQAQDVSIGVTPPLQWTTSADIGPLSATVTRIFNVCSIALELQDGEATALSDTFTDSFTGEECPFQP